MHRGWFWAALPAAISGLGMNAPARASPFGPPSLIADGFEAGQACTAPWTSWFGAGCSCETVGEVLCNGLCAVPSDAPCGDGGDDCDNCDFVCNFDQSDTLGFRAEVIAPIAISGGDCVDSTNGYSGETDDLELADDELSLRFDLDDEDGDGVVEGSETGDFTFSFFGQAIDGFRVSSNGFVRLLVDGEDVPVLDAAPTPAPLLQFDGVDDIVAAAWTDLKASTENPAGTTDPCVSIFIVGDNTASNQQLRVTWENAILSNSADNLSKVTVQLRLLETSNRIEIHTVIQSDLQLVTRGVEGLYGDGGDSLIGVAVLPGDNLTAMVRTNDSVAYSTSLLPENDPLLESGDACANGEELLTCGDGTCYEAAESFLDCPEDCPP
jgi:hypothetical protein